MKKTYIQPACDVLRLETEGALLNASKVAVDNEHRSDVILNNRSEGAWNSEYRNRACATSTGAVLASGRGVGA